MTSRQSKLPEEVIKQIALYTSSSYRETVERGYTCFSVAVPRDTIIATQRTLVDNALTLQELISQIFRMIAEKDPVFAPVIECAVQNPIRGGNDYIIMNENSIYSLIEAARRQEETKNNESSGNEQDTSMEAEDLMHSKINATSFDFKTFRQDKFLQNRVNSALVALKEKTARKKITGKE